MDNIFDKYWQRYDTWYDENQAAFLSEVLAVNHFLPGKGTGLDIGTGTGLFTQKLRIEFGIDRSINMLKKAARRGLKVCKAEAENLPFNNDSFDFVTIITSLSFISKPVKAVNESYRVLKENGSVILGIINRESTLAKAYKEKKSKFYQEANFLSLNQASEILTRAGFAEISYVYTLSALPEEMTDIEQPRPQCDDCGFMVIRAIKDS